MNIWNNTDGSISIPLHRSSGGEVCGENEEKGRATKGMTVYRCMMLQPRNMAKTASL